MQACLINFEIIIFNIYYENEEIIKKGVPQSAKISKLEWISWKFPSQLEFGGEQLFWGTAREVLFRWCMVSYMKHRKSIEKTMVYDKQSTLVSQNMTNTIRVSCYSQKQVFVKFRFFVKSRSSLLYSPKYSIFVHAYKDLFQYEFDSSF